MKAIESHFTHEKDEDEYNNEESECYKENQNEKL